MLHQEAGQMMLRLYQQPPEVFALKTSPHFNIALNVDGLRLNNQRRRRRNSAFVPFIFALVRSVLLDQNLLQVQIIQIIFSYYFMNLLMTSRKPRSVNGDECRFWIGIWKLPVFREAVKPRLVGGDRAHGATFFTGECLFILSSFVFWFYPFS